MRLHHVGIVVEDLAKYGEAYGKFLGLSVDSPAHHDPIQVHIQFWKDGGGNLLELIEPAAPDSPVHGVLKKGGGLNHLCYEVDDLDEEAFRLRFTTAEIPNLVSVGRIQEALDRLVKPRAPARPTAAG